MQYELDLTGVAPKRIYPLGEKFTGHDSPNHELSFTNYYMAVDGKPFFGVCGEIHFFRISEDQWEDTIIKAKMGGINIIAIYEDFLRRYAGVRTAFLELGVGMNTPIIIKYPFWKMTAQNPKATYVCLNVGMAYSPNEIEKQSIVVDYDIGKVL